MNKEPHDRIAADEEITERHRDVRREWERYLGVRIPREQGEWKHIYPEDASAELERREREERAEGLGATVILF